MLRLNLDLIHFRQRAKGLFENNDPAKGGSAYLQQKITIAEKILLEVSAGVWATLIPLRACFPTSRPAHATQRV
jgi:hypothetical protein